MISPGLPSESTSGLGFAVEQIKHTLSAQLTLTVIQPEDVNDQGLKKKTGAKWFTEEKIVEDLTHISIRGNLSPYSYVGEQDNHVENGRHIRSEFNFFTKQVSEIAHTLDYDLIYAHDWVTFEAARKLKEKSNVPLVLHVHSLDVDRISSTNHSWVYAIEKEAFGYADAIITVSQYSAERINRFYQVPHSKIHTIYNGCSLQLFPNYKKNV